MSYHYVLHELAQEDYETSIKWYLERSESTAENFITAIDKALELICHSPFRWRNTYKHFHELSLRKFPFTIIYEIHQEEQKIIVTAIYHHKRNPKKKYR